MIPRFVQLGFDVEQMAVAAGVIYLAVRFGIAGIFQRYTVHRGMWHSLPAAAIAGLLTFLIVSGTTLEIRLFKTAAVVLGFLIHLLLDEFWSFEMRRGRLRIKRSLGTALKLWTTRGLWPNVTTYGKLALLVVLVVEDPYLMDQLGVEQIDFAQQSRQWVQQVIEPQDSPPDARTPRTAFDYPATTSPVHR
jgi:putative flippase GtrA